MALTLFINRIDNVAEYLLPAVNNKRIQLDISDVCSDCIMLLEVYEGRWRVLSTKNLSVLEDDKKSEYADIHDGAVIKMMSGNAEFALLVKDIFPERNNFRKYTVSGKKSVSVGRAEDNDIVISDQYVGSHHCVLNVYGNCTITDNSKNGTFINGKRISGTVSLNIFDTVYITGHKIIYLGKAIAVCDNDITVNNLSEADVSEIINTELYVDNSFLSRAPRRMEPLDTETVEIDDPPAKQKMRRQPLIFIIGPSVTMPLPILVSVLVNIAVNSQASRSGIMYLGTALSVLLSAAIGTGWALAHQKYDQKVIAEDEKERTDSYNLYIKKNKELLEEKQAKNKSILEHSYLSTEKLAAAAENNRELIWNRNIYQNDFLTIRLGTGQVKLPSEIVVSKKRFSLNNDELEKYPSKLRDEYEVMKNCISTINILSHKIIGLVGEKDVLPLIVNNMVCQLALLHCYTDVKIGFFCEDTDRTKYLWTKWLPHSFIRGKESRISGFDDQSRESMIYTVVSELRKRTESADENKKSIILPHIIIFCTSADLMRNSALAGYMTSPEYLGVTFVLVYGNMNALPNECRAIIEYSKDYKGFYLLDGNITDENKISFDLVSAEKAEKTARTVSGYYVDEISTGSIPSSVDYFDMIKIGNIEQWDILKHYKSSHSYEGLKSFIGLGLGGKPVYLDIHDKKDGPHGLVAGTTGSGKSETLQTFILSLAMNYGPGDVAFVLIDYKGGGMANVFAGMPHIAGMITNLSDESSGELDRSATRRACSSLRSEIKRRQGIFNQYKINHIDAYSRLYDEGVAPVPMPHLIIISDEFAELKKEQPEFIRELISVARVGRSLGIHLILATQKPSGVVDDEIWSNSKFKICLRVQDKQDSTGMLKRPDAAYITEAGRAFLQIGNDEIFEEFQSGYSGGEYVPKDKVISAADSEAVMIRYDGSAAVIRTKHKKSSDSLTELAAAVKHISAEAVKNGIEAADALWLPPLENRIFLEDISENTSSDGITAVYGMADNYEQQTQYPCCIDLSECSNLKICGTTGSGKTTLVQTILCSVLQRYSPEQFNFYVMDFSSRTFKMFRRLPHCGGVVYEEETEAAARLIKLISDTVDERKRLFEREEIGSYKEYSKLHSLPLIALVIDNFGAFIELYGDLEEKMIKLMRDSVRYGIQIIVTVNNTSEIKYKMRSYVLDSIVLRLGDKSEYSEFFGRTPEFLPTPVNGRGLMISGGTVIEYQAALPVKGINESVRSEMLKKRFDGICAEYTGSVSAKKIPIISKDTCYSDILSEFNVSDMLLTGINYETIEPAYALLSDFFRFAVSGHSAESISRFMNNVCEYAAYNKVSIKAVRLSADIKFEVSENSEVFSSIAEVHKLLDSLLEEFSKKRNILVPEWKANGGGETRDKYIADRCGRIFVIIDDMSKFAEIIHNDSESEHYVKLTELLLNGGKDHAIHFFGGYLSMKKSYLSLSNTFKSENQGIHFGGRVSEQNVLEMEMPLPQKLKPLDNHIGYSLINGKVISVYEPERKL